MPLHTRIVRDGEPVTIRWDYFHVHAMMTAAALEDGTMTPEQVAAGEPVPPTSLSSKGRVTLTVDDLTFHDTSGQADDLVLLKGDVLEMWR